MARRRHCRLEFAAPSLMTPKLDPDAAERGARALVAGFPISNDALSQGDIRQHSASGSAVVRHMRWISRAGNHACNGRMGENKFQQDLCPASAPHLARPVRQRPVAEAPQKAAATERYVDQDGNTT